MREEICSLTLFTKCKFYESVVKSDNVKTFKNTFCVYCIKCQYQDIQKHILYTGSRVNVKTKNIQKYIVCTVSRVNVKTFKNTFCTLYHVSVSKHSKIHFVHCITCQCQNIKTYILYTVSRDLFCNILYRL